MARGRARNQKRTVTLTKNGGWEISYYVYLTDPVTQKLKRHHRSRVVGHKSAMRKIDAEQILRQEPTPARVRVPAHGTITFGEWMRNVYVPMRAANWRAATRRTNEDYLKCHICPAFEHVQLKDISKFNVQMLFNRMAKDGYSYTVAHHVRDLIKAGLAEAVDQAVMERNVARKTVIPDIEERDKLPIGMYCKLLARLTDVRDRAIFLIGSFCALRSSELLR